MINSAVVILNLLLILFTCVSNAGGESVGSMSSNGTGKGGSVFLPSHVSFFAPFEQPSADLIH